MPTPSPGAVFQENDPRIERFVKVLAVYGDRVKIIRIKRDGTTARGIIFNSSGAKAVGSNADGSKTSDGSARFGSRGGVEGHATSRNGGLVSNRSHDYACTALARAGIKPGPRETQFNSNGGRTRLRPDDGWNI